MKSAIQLFGTVLFFLVMTVSCKKENHHKTITQTIDLNLGMNETYSFSFPVNTQPEITKQASHASNSVITTDNSTNLTQFTYTPTKDFVGTDEINIQLKKSKDNYVGNGILPGGCYGGNHGGDDRVDSYSFKINIINVEKPG
ncbi:MAG: hypothetical protein U0U67_10950 [Chitinophagales bacterium]